MYFYNMLNDERESFKKMRFWKFLNHDENHNGFQYKDGLNIDNIPFYPHEFCQPGGFYFTDTEHIFGFAGYGDHIREVTFPEDAQVYEEEHKWKADKIILGKRYELNEDGVQDELNLKTVKMLIELGANLTSNCGGILMIASSVGDLKLVKYLVEHCHVDIHSNSEYALQKAAQRGHLDIVKYFIEMGSDIHAESDLALFWASQQKQYDVISYIESLP